MKPIVILCLAVLVISCTTKEEKVLRIIDRTVGDRTIDIFIMPIPYYFLEGFANYNEHTEYEMVRHIYRNGGKKERKFYVVDMTEERVVLTSSKYNLFFEPIASKMWGKAMTDLSGDSFLK